MVGRVATPDISKSVCGVSSKAEASPRLSPVGVGTVAAHLLTTSVRNGADHSQSPPLLQVGSWREMDLMGMLILWLKPSEGLDRLITP